MNRQVEGFEMPRPIILAGDSMNRYWVELAAVNPSLVDLLRPALVTFLAFDKDRSVSPQTTVGTGFICGSNPESGIALVVTAKHVLDGVRGIQAPRPLHAPSAYFVPNSSRQISLDPTKLKVVWMDSYRSAMMDMVSASFNESTDLACCVIDNRKEGGALRLPSVLLDTGVPEVGDIVHMVSIDEMHAIEMDPPKGATGHGQELKISRRTSIRRGTVTGVYPGGFGQYKWPCFTTTIPAVGGMSGGLVYKPIDGRPISACGIVCADLDPYQSKVDQYQCGYSVVGCSWPVLALRLPDSIPEQPNGTTISILDLIRKGAMSVPTGGVGGFEIENIGEGEYKLTRS